MLHLTLAARYLWGRKLRTVLTTLAVVFGVMVLFGMNIILPTMLRALQTNAMAAQGIVDLTIVHVSGEPFDATVLDKARPVAGVRAASASLNRTINLPADFYDRDPLKLDRVTALTLVGVRPEDARTIRAYVITAGRCLAENDGPAAVISQSLADKLGLGVGGRFRIPTAVGVRELTVVGILPPHTVPGNEEVLVTLAQAQAMTELAGKVNVIELNLDSFAEARRNETIAAIEAVLGPEYKVGTLLSGVEVFAAVEVGQITMNVFGVLALFMGAFIIFNTFRTIVVERRRDLGLLRAVGASRRTVIGMILIEGLTQGVIGTVLGLALGYLLALIITRLASPIMSQFINLRIGDPVVSWSTIALSSGLGLGVTLLAGLLPALNAGRVTPLEALNRSMAEVEFKRQFGPAVTGGVTLIVISLAALFTKQMLLAAPGAFLFLIGLTLAAPALIYPLARLFGRILAPLHLGAGLGELAQGNLTRQPVRAAVTASASMLGLAVVVAAGGMVASLTLTVSEVLRKSLGSDYLLMPPSVSLWNNNLGAGPELADQMRAIPGVAAVSTMRFATSAAGGQAVSLMGIDPQVFPQVAGLRFQNNLFFDEAAAYRAIAAERALIANGVFLSELDVAVGDTVELVTPTGPRVYRIVAQAADLFNVKLTTAYISQANMLADFGKAEDVFIQLNLRPGADVKAAEAAIRAAAEAYPQFYLIAGKSYYDAMMLMLNTAFNGMYFVLAMLAVPSLIAMLNTLVIGIIERTREIGMLRAVGATRQQVRRLVTAEALLLAAIGVTFGTAAGLYLSYVIVIALSEIFPLGYAFPTMGVVAAGIIGLSFGGLAAVLPARQAAHLDIIAALRYE